MPFWAVNGQLGNKRPKDATRDLGLMTQKSPVLDVLPSWVSLAFMRTAPGCCYLRVPALLRCAQESIQRLEDIVNRAIVQIALVVSQELYVTEKLLAIDLVEVAQVVLHGKVKKETEAVVVRPQRFLAFALLVFALKELKLCEPLVHSVRDFRPSSVIQILNDGHVCVESFEV